MDGDLFVCDLRSIFLQIVLFDDYFLIASESVEALDLLAILNVAVNSYFNSVSQTPDIQLADLNGPLDIFLVHFIRSLTDMPYVT